MDDIGNWGLYIECVISCLFVRRKITDGENVLELLVHSVDGVVNPGG